MPFAWLVVSLCEHESGGIQKAISNTRRAKGFGLVTGTCATPADNTEFEVNESQYWKTLKIKNISDKPSGFALVASAPTYRRTAKSDAAEFFKQFGDIR